jgi:regulator of replication initiation timing
LGIGHFKQSQTKARMEKAVKIICVLLQLMAMAVAKEEFEDIVKDLKTEMNDMNEHLLLNEKTLNVTQKELIQTKEELARTKEVLKQVEDAYKNKDQKLAAGTPYFHVCGAHWGGQENIIAKTITYDTLDYYSTNVNGAGLDINNGVLTSGHSGAYTVTWGFIADAEDNSGNTLNIYLRKNGQNIYSSQLFLFLHILSKRKSPIVLLKRWLIC